MSPKIVKLHVEKGLTFQVDDKTWSKSAYRLEADLSDGPSPDELEKLRLDLSFKIDDWLGQEKHIPQSKPLQPEEVVRSDIPQLDLAELDECPWQTYKKQPAKPGQVAWIKNPTFWEHFDATPVLWELVKAVEGAKDQKLVLGDMEYNFGGKDDMKDRFINRKPVKTESAR